MCLNFFFFKKRICFYLGFDNFIQCPAQSLRLNSVVPMFLLFPRLERGKQVFCGLCVSYELTGWQASEETLPFILQTPSVQSQPSLWAPNLWK